MAKLPRNLIALPVRWASAALNATVTDDVGAARTVAVKGAGVLWTRTFLAPTSGGSSESAPTDLLRYVQGQLNAGGGSWTISMQDTGRVRIAYGGSGTGSITWGSSSPMRNALGFAGNVSLPSGTYDDSDYLPAFCWLLHTIDNDTGPRSEPSHLVGARHADGTVTAWSEGVTSLDRSFRARFCPSTETVRTAKGWYATPYFPPDDAPTRRTAPSATPEDCPTAWTVHETLSCAHGLRLAYSIGSLQDLIAGSTTRYDVGALDPESARTRDQRAALTVPAYTSLVDVPGVTLTWITTETR